jgi:hypothetical protein
VFTTNIDECKDFFDAMDKEDRCIAQKIFEIFVSDKKYRFWVNYRNGKTKGITSISLRSKSVKIKPKSVKIKFPPFFHIKNNGKIGTDYFTWIYESLRKVLENDSSKKIADDYAEDHSKFFGENVKTVRNASSRKASLAQVRVLKGSVEAFKNSVDKCVERIEEAMNSGSRKQ